MSASDRVHAACRGLTDSRELRRRVLKIVRTVVGFDAYAWLLTDPETSVGSSPLADVPCPLDLHELIRLKYQAADNRWTSLTPGHAVSLAAAPPGPGTGGLAWRAFLARYDVSDVASTVFRDDTGCWGFLDLWRCGGRLFEAAELEDLDLALAPLTDALRRCQAAMFEVPADSGGPTEPGVLLLSPTLQVRRQTAAADAHLRALLPTEKDRQPIPATAYNVAAQLLAGEAGADRHPPSTRVALQAGQWWTFRAARLTTALGAEDGDIAVTIERATPRERMDLYCRVYGLTPRETEVLRCLADGDDTRTVSGRLHLSEFTVQDHLKSVFAKTGVRSRRALLARSAG